MTKIKKILIANRGEIACRVMKTCRKMGIGSVAVYSDADRKALHVRMADEAVHIGASPAAESYLVIDKIIAACKFSGADAVHPGYGFLSENPGFARRLKKEGITFIGPSPESMEAMGLKDAAKKLMEKAGVPVTPGYHGKDQNAKLLKAKAGMIGYPVLIKAIAGGGGKGMRKVDAAGDFDDALASCMREAKSAFGDDRVLIEKYILSPRHIEVQVFGDTHGNVVHMYERDCSLQRRHQKVIEEAPAPGMTEDVRAAMTKAAIEAAQAVNYVGAGTVEFIVDGSGKLRTDGFWFMEMNTRLQVEHPVTEMITGLDLVELQIKVAQGERLPKQKDITMAGHAIEARIYAEDPANDFLPSIGKLEFFRQPALGLKRIDTGVMQGDSIGIYYDPMIAKAIAHEGSRAEALEKLRRGLSLLGIWPLKTNVEFLYTLLRSKAFQTGNMSTHTLPNELEAILEAMTENQAERIAQLSKFAIEKFIESPKRKPVTPFEIVTSRGLMAWRMSLPSGFSQTLYINGEEINIHLDQSSEKWSMTVNGVKYAYDHGSKGRTLNPSYFPTVTVGEKSPLYILQTGRVFHVSLSPLGTDTAHISNGNAITAPMPGKIIAVNVAVGDNVKAGDKLIIMEAMKMEMSLEAPRDGVVAAVHTSADALVSDGEVLLELEQEDA